MRLQADWPHYSPLPFSQPGTTWTPEGTDMRLYPHRCPVCEGRGMMPHGFYDRRTVSSSMEPDPCHSCQGSGIVWAWA